MELHQLRYFVAAAETGSISRAARRCAVSQPSISQQIRRLETGLGVDLFDRLGRGVEMTDAGRALLPRARRLLRDIDDAEAHVTGARWRESARLALGAIPTVAPFVLPPLVSALKSEFPEGDFEIREDLTENLIDALVESAIDVAIVSTPIEHPLVEIEVVGREEMLVVVPDGHPLHHAGSVRSGDLRDEPAVTLHEMHCLGRQISAFCTQRHLHRPIVCRTTQLATLVEMVRRRLGVSVVPAMAARHDTGRGVAFLPMRGGRPEREIAVAWRTGRTRSHIGGRLSALLAEQLRAA